MERGAPDQRRLHGVSRVDLSGGYLGIDCSHNDVLLNQILKKDWGFDGAVISDWSAVHDTLEAANNGLDLEMGTRVPEGGTYDDYFLGQAYRDAI